jgi:hypothetical protein
MVSQNRLVQELVLRQNNRMYHSLRVGKVCDCVECTRLKTEERLIEERIVKLSSDERSC